ncbi:ribosomal-protein-alanine N-acetyltransferase [Cytobacillus eiseniae]|uniref:[Ribosomal protein bS18]-alanine N-acetyltransferase n=1 Tax=Cytobacillus eiseniae TaxID=762947 RepID=A0ABS4RG01_9BACI|nr:ribosomal protein S18-alanine N-acetyltransferase [Cytobacillus eiseniae]MBP2241837.1 ribosomal-protein-alanine N-acetyltransferase [Cytobacillus eiseniae]
MNRSLTFRLLNVNDVDDILKIEHECFSLPWSREAFENELSTNQHAVYLGLEDDGVVIGYCGVWIVVDEAQITNVAILPEYRGNKLGEAIMRQVMEVASRKGARLMSLEVRVSNEIAQSLYRKLGFQNGGIRKNYYSDNQEDALVMWVNL